MKRLKIGLFTAILILFMVHITATAESINIPAVHNKPTPGENNFLHDQGVSHDTKVFKLNTSGMHGVEVKTQDEMNTMTWSAADTATKQYGAGWRLPTITELKKLYEHRKSIGGFSEEDYWSSTEQDINSAWIQGFRLGDQDRYNKQSKLRVRAVRSF